MVHECLEGAGGIAEAKEHDSQLKKTQRSDERCFPLIFLSDLDVVVSPSNVELGEVRGVLHIINEFRDEG